MTRHEQHQRTWAVHICINLAIYVSIGVPHDCAHAGLSMLMRGRGAGVDVGRRDTLAWGCVVRGGGVERGKWLGVERGGMWWEGGGRKTKDNDVATQPTVCQLSERAGRVGI